MTTLPPKARENGYPALPAVENGSTRVDPACFERRNVKGNRADEHRQRDAQRALR